MTKYLCFLIGLLVSFAVADVKAGYEQQKADIQEQKRVLNRLHMERRYEEAMAQQKAVVALSEDALRSVLKSTDVPVGEAWLFHADILRDVGLTDQALQALDSYMRTPSLTREEQLQGWKKRTQIYRRARSLELYRAAFAEAYALADQPKEKFRLRMDRAGFELGEHNVTEAEEEIEPLRRLLLETDEEDRLSLERDLQSLLVRLYKENGDEVEWRKARQRELEVRIQLLEREREQL